MDAKTASKVKELNEKLDRKQNIINGLVSQVMELTGLTEPEVMTMVKNRDLSSFGMN